MAPFLYRAADPVGDAVSIKNALASAVKHAIGVIAQPSSDCRSAFTPRKHGADQSPCGLISTDLDDALQSIPRAQLNHYSVGGRTPMVAFRLMGSPLRKISILIVPPGAIRAT